MTILYLHGATMTPGAFNFYRTKIKHKEVSPHYNIDNGLTNNVDAICDELKDQVNRPVNIIAHSMGGLIALGLLEHGLPIRKIVTLSTPFGGTIASSHLKWLYPDHVLFHDTCAQNIYLKTLREQDVTVPMMSVVTTGGSSPLQSTANDGVVPIDSQQNIKGPTEFIYSDLNHYEILLCSETITTVKNFIK
jgi:triacylglycerol esterase/lipase EstA (alpha/beta hydrolase family)